MIAERFRRVLGESHFRALEGLLRNEVGRALNTDALSRELPSLAERFWARLSLPLADASEAALSNLDEAFGLEEELATTLAGVIENTGYRYADDLTYGLSALVDHGLWILEKAREVGLEELAKRIADRASREILEHTGCTLYLAFTWTAAAAAVLGVAEKYRGENRDALVRWSRGYAEEVEEYIDTLDLMVDDEIYRELAELGVIEERYL